jgi:hypothetical protein
MSGFSSRPLVGIRNANTQKCIFATNLVLIGASGPLCRKRSISMPVNNHKPIARRANDPSPHILWSKAILPASSSHFQLPLLQEIGRNMSAQKPIKIFCKTNPPRYNSIYFKRIAKGDSGLLFSPLAGQAVAR